MHDTSLETGCVMAHQDTAQKLRELFKAGWSLQVAPEPTAFGVIYASVVWSRQRDPIDATLDGALASLPLLQRVNLADPTGFSENVNAMYARVFPVSPFGDLDDVDDEDAPDIPEREL